MLDWLVAGFMVLLLAAAVALWLRLGSRTAPEGDGPVERSAKDILERLGRIDAENRESLGRRLSEFSQEVTKAHADSRKELAERLETMTRANAEQLTAIRQEVDKKLSETTTKNREHFGEVATRLAKLSEVAGQMTGQMNAVTPDIQKLAAALSTPKGRGAFGELSLTEILRDVIPPEFLREQYAIEGAERVDAAILLKEGILPIDSKFTLPAGYDPSRADDGTPESKESAKLFRRAVEERAREISSKYIRPGKTLDFAFMYVPAESVYYRVVMDRDLHRGLLKQKVIPVSPNSLYAYLQAIAVGLRGMKLEANALAVQKLILQLKNDFDRFGNDFRMLGNHLENARKKFVETERDVLRFTDRVQQLSLGEGETRGEIPAPPVPEAPPRPVARGANGAGGV